jgi:hypothetical protein
MEGVPTEGEYQHVQTGMQAADANVGKTANVTPERQAHDESLEDWADNLLGIKRMMDPSSLALKGIVSRDFVVCFLVSFDRSDISTHQEWVLLLLKVSFCIKFFDFRVWA